MNQPSGNNTPTLAIVVPCYNEEQALAFSISVLLRACRQLVQIRKIGVASKIYFVDDGSTDDTWKVLEKAASEHPEVVALKLSRNRGHQNALFAGLYHTHEDMVVSIDADLQDGAEQIEAMVDEFLRGFDVVYGVRSDRGSDTLFKRHSAENFYRLMRMLGVDLVFNHSECRLLSRRAVDALLQYPEVNLFLRGMVRELGYPSTKVYYTRAARVSGDGKHSWLKLASLAWNGITSFSIAPLRAITLLGAISSVISMALIVWVLEQRLFTDNAVPGWASIMLPLLFIGSVQLLCLGVVGEYLGKLYQEVKRRPRFHVEKLAGATLSESKQPLRDR